MPTESLASASGEDRRNGDSDSSALSSVAATIRTAECRHFHAFEDLLPFLDGATRVQRVQVQLDSLKDRPVPSALVHESQGNRRKSRSQRRFGHVSPPSTRPLSRTQTPSLRWSCSS